MNLLFVADPLESFKAYKDTTYTMMREAARRGHGLCACEPRSLRWQQGRPVTARVRPIALTGREDGWFTEDAARDMALKDFDAVLMRKDPPFDAEYIYATHLLEQAEREGARSTPSTAKSCSSRWTAWAAWGSSASAPTG